MSKWSPGERKCHGRILDKPGLGSIKVLGPWGVRNTQNHIGSAVGYNWYYLGDSAHVTYDAWRSMGFHKLSRFRHTIDMHAKLTHISHIFNNFHVWG